MPWAWFALGALGALVQMRWTGGERGRVGKAEQEERPKENRRSESTKLRNHEVTRHLFWKFLVVFVFSLRVSGRSRRVRLGTHPPARPLHQSPHGVIRDPRRESRRRRAADRRSRDASGAPSHRRARQSGGNQIPERFHQERAHSSGAIVGVRLAPGGRGLQHPGSIFQLRFGLDELRAIQPRALEVTYAASKRGGHRFFEGPPSRSSTVSSLTRRSRPASAAARAGR